MNLQDATKRINGVVSGFMASGRDTKKPHIILESWQTPGRTIGVAFCHHRNFNQMLSKCWSQTVSSQFVPFEIQQICGYFESTDPPNPMSTLKQCQSQPALKQPTQACNNFKKINPISNQPNPTSVRHTSSQSNVFPSVQHLVDDTRGTTTP